MDFGQDLCSACSHNSNSKLHADKGNVVVHCAGELILCNVAWRHRPTPDCVTAQTQHINIAPCQRSNQHPLGAQQD